jgi:hypothetical protein
MSFEKISKLLKGDTPGRSAELHYSRLGPDDAARRCIASKGFLIYRKKIAVV